MNKMLIIVGLVLKLTCTAYNRNMVFIRLRDKLSINSKYMLK